MCTSKYGLHGLQMVAVSGCIRQSPAWLGQACTHALHVRNHCMMPDGNNVYGTIGVHHNAHGAKYLVHHTIIIADVSCSLALANSR